MKKALNTGITGQDGSYLAEPLLAKGIRATYADFCSRAASRQVTAG